MAKAAPMAEILRGGFLESLHVGHAAVVRPDGEIVEAWGDPSTTIIPRSSSKILQALPLLESGAGKSLSSERLALACASHSGETRHVEKVRAWLGEIGRTEDDLKCGPQASRDPELRDHMLCEKIPVTRAFNNCSGKHTGFLMLAKHLGAGPDYVDPEHPVQKAVREAFEDMTGEESPGYGVDGCSAPNFATSVRGLARAMARTAAARPDHGAREDAAARLRDAMNAHPEMVAGKGRFGVAAMAAAHGRAIVKSGAEGVYVAMLPDLGLGVALKIADGAARGSELAIAALLVRLGILDRNDPAVAALIERPIHNWDGLTTGSERAVPGLLG